MNDYPYRWFLRKQLPERWGRRCRIAAIGKKHALTVEFLDGVKVACTRSAIRRVRHG